MFKSERREKRKKNRFVRDNRKSVRILLFILGK